MKNPRARQYGTYIYCHGELVRVIPQRDSRTSTLCPICRTRVRVAW